MRMQCMLVALLLLGYSCEKSNTTGPSSVFERSLSLSHNRITIEKGDSWLYKTWVIRESNSATFDLPDTLAAYSFFRAVKDTVIYGRPYIIIEGKDYDVGEDSITTYNKRSAIHLSDTIRMYEFNTSGYSGLMSGIMKRMSVVPYVSYENYSTRTIRKALFCKLALLTRYDTSIFMDLVYPIIFPLHPESVYVYRDSGDPRGNLPFYHRFMGIDTVTVSYGTFPAYKFEYLPDDDSITFSDWIGANGRLKRYLYWPSIEVRNSLGETKGYMEIKRIYELIGRHNINPDTLVPWGRAVQHE